MPTKHAAVGPSKLESFEACPCYDREPYEEKDDQGESPSERGTRLHLAVETEDLTLCHNDQEKALVQMCIDGCQALAASAGEGAEVLREVEVSIPDPEDPFEVLTWGTADWVLMYPGRKKARGRDYKFIRTPSVSAPDKNLQIRAYGVGLLCQFPELETVEFDLIMPEFNHLPDAVVLTRADIEPTQQRIKAIRLQREDPFKQPCPGGICTTCKHARRCPALTKVALRASAGLGLPMPESFAPNAPRSPYERSLALVLATMLAQWAEQTKTHMNEFGKAGNTELPGFKWMTRKGNPKILSTAQAKSLVLLSDPDFLDCCRVSITELAKKYAVVHQISEKLARERLNAALAPVIVRGADVAFWQRAKDGETDAEIVAGVKQEAPLAVTAAPVATGYEQSEARASLPG